MKGENKLPSQKWLRYLFDYNQDTGLLTVKKQIRPKEYVGWSTKPRAEGYLRQIVGVLIYPTHRLIWMWMTGEDPGILEVDHKDRNPSNNAWSNLRVGTSKQNNENRRAKGIYWHKKNRKWEAQVQHDGKHYHVGVFDCPLLARMAYLDKKKELHSWGY